MAGMSPCSQPCHWSPLRVSCCAAWIMVRRCGISVSTLRRAAAFSHRSTQSRLVRPCRSISPPNPRRDRAWALRRAMNRSQGRRCRHPCGSLRSLWESGSCGESRFTKRGHAPACWLTSVAVCKPMSLGLHAATATSTRPATHCGVRLSSLHNLRTISTFFAQMRQTTPNSGGTFFYKCRNILKERCTKCRCFIHRPRGHREWMEDSGKAGCR